MNILFKNSIFLLCNRQQNRYDDIDNDHATNKDKLSYYNRLILLSIWDSPWNVNGNAKWVAIQSINNNFSDL